MNLGRWEKHNVMQFVTEKGLNEFTLEKLLKKITGEKMYYYGYYATNISNILQELVIEKKLKATYFSQGGKSIASYTIYESN